MATTLPPFRSDGRKAIEGIVLQPTDPLVPGQYYLGDGKFILATGADTTVSSFKTNHSVSTVNPVNWGYRLSDMLPDGRTIFE